MFRQFRRIADATTGLLTELRHIRNGLEQLDLAGEDGPLAPRVSELERVLRNQLAEAESLALRAEEMLKQARRAEERERHHAKRAEEAEERVADLDEEGMDPFERAARAHQLSLGDVEGSEGEGLRSMPNSMAPDRAATEAEALTGKWNR